MSKRASDVPVMLPATPPPAQRDVAIVFSPDEAEALLRLAREGATVLELDPKILPRVGLRHGATTGLRRLATAIRNGAAL